MCFRLVSHLPRTKILKGLSTLDAREPVLGYRHKMVLVHTMSTRYVTVYIVTPFHAVRRHF